jgi:hypothetical protein
MEYWNNGIMEKWSVGIMEYWDMCGKNILVINF